MGFVATKEVLITIANELARKAKSSIPNLREGEKIRREWFKNGVYFRETVLNGDIFLAQYNFKNKTIDWGIQNE